MFQVSLLILRKFSTIFRKRSTLTKARLRVCGISRTQKAYSFNLTKKKASIDLNKVEELIDLLGSEVVEKEGSEEEENDYLILEGLRVISQEGFQDIEVNKVRLKDLEESKSKSLKNQSCKKRDRRRNLQGP